MQNRTPLDLAIQHEGDRRKASIDELIKLSNIVVDKVKNNPNISIYDLKQQAVSNLELNIEQMNSLMKYLNEYHAHDMSYALKTNKNLLIFKESINFINSHMDELCSKSMNQYLKLDSEKPTYFYDADNDLGTGQPTFAATALLTILGILEEETLFSNLKEVLGDIYDVETSPLVQTVKFPKNFEVSEVQGLEDSFYYYEDASYKGMVVPTLGYYYGGSRNDPEYFSKEYRAFDCSYFVAELCDLPIWMTTRDMISAYKGDCKKGNKICEDILKKLKPKSDIDVGDILVVGNHTGIVTNVDNTSFALLSYNRELPYMDGIGYKEYAFEDDKSYYPFEYIQDEITIA